MKALQTMVMSVSVRTAGALCCAAVVSCAQHEATAPAGTSSGPPAIRYEAHISAGGQPPVGAGLNNPVLQDPAATKNGETLFSAMNCDGCHGGGGTGWVGPSLADGRWRYGGADEEIFTSIYFGRPKGMPAFGGTISPTAIWSIVKYIKSLPPPPNAPTESWED